MTDDQWATLEPFAIAFDAAKKRCEELNAEKPTELRARIQHMHDEATSSFQLNKAADAMAMAMTKALGVPLGVVHAMLVTEDVEDDS